MNANIIYTAAWKQKRTAELVISAVLQGFRAIESGGQPRNYREDLVGKALQTLYNDHGFKRRDLFLQSKYVQLGSQDSTLPLPYNPSDSLRVQVTASFYASLNFFGTGYLDAFILHQKLPTYPQTLEAWKALIKLQDLGKVRAIGIRNVYSVGLLERLGKESGRPVQIVQDRWRSRNNWDSNILDWCRKNGAQFQGSQSIAGSRRLLSSPVLKKIASDKNCSRTQVLYRFAQSQGVTPLSGCTTDEHMQQDLEAEGVELDQGEIDSLVKQVEQLTISRRRKVYGRDHTASGGHVH